MPRQEMGLPKLSIKRGDIWELDFEPQTHKQEPGKRNRPALVIQTDILNDAGHSTVIVIPGTTDVYQDAQGDGFPLRVGLGATCGKTTDLLISQIRAVARQRFMGAQPIATLSRNQMKRVEEALRVLQNL